MLPNLVDPGFRKTNWKPLPVRFVCSILIQDCATQRFEKNVFISLWHP